MAERRMTPAQINETQKLARDWKLRSHLLVSGALIVPNWDLSRHELREGRLESAAVIPP
jgi:hypothetical protein